MKKIIILVLAFGAGMAFAEFRAGFARVDATPPLGLPLVGYFTTRIADGVLDPLYIDCVAVSDGTNNALIYCVDDLQLSNAFLAKAVPEIIKAKKGECDFRDQYLEFDLPAYGGLVFEFTY